MYLFIRLLFAHILIDFPLQTDRLYQWKTRALEGTVFHSMLFFFAVMLIAPALRVYAWFWLYAGFLTVFHIAIDWSKACSTSSMEKDTLWTFLIDQAMHMALLIPALWLDRLIEPPMRANAVLIGFSLDNRALASIIGFMVSGFVFTIMLPYIKKLVFAIPGHITISRQERLYEPVERIVLSATFFLGHYYWAGALMVAGHAALIVADKKHQKKTALWFNLVCNIIAGAGIGLVMRGILW